MAATERLAYGFAPLAVLALLSALIYRAFYRLYFHPLSKFPGPRLAAVTNLWQAWKECVSQTPFHKTREAVHARYGEVVRIGPDELHFSDPRAYLEIYNNQRRWNKEPRLYQSFCEDRSSFGFLTYRESKERKDVLNKTFSAQSITQATPLILEKIDELCATFEQLARDGRPADLTWGFRSLTLDVITYLCFGKAMDAIHEPDYRAPLLVAMDASIPSFKLFKHAKWYRDMIVGCPPNISRMMSPATAGLIDMQQLLRTQIADLTAHPERIDHLPHNMTIYHQLMNKKAYPDGIVPDGESLFDEAQALMFAGADTAANVLMLSTYYLLKQPDTYRSLKEELRRAWPDLKSPPPLRDLEQLPYLDAVIKEGLRLSSGVISGLLRIVPNGGAKICETYVPGGTVVSCGSTFVHYNSELFPEPYKFRPERWLENPKLENWLVAFSRGPRSCPGINLAWTEMRLCLPYVFRRFDMELGAGSPEQLEFWDTFLPSFIGDHPKANIRIVHD